MDVIVLHSGLDNVISQYIFDNIFSSIKVSNFFFHVIPLFLFFLIISIVLPTQFFTMCILITMLSLKINFFFSFLKLSLLYEIKEYFVIKVFFSRLSFCHRLFSPK